MGFIEDIVEAWRTGVAQHGENFQPGFKLEAIVTRADTGKTERILLSTGEGATFTAAISADTEDHDG